MHIACVGLPLGYEEIFMQASYMGTDPASQQAAGTGEEFTQEEAVDAVEEMLERRQEDVQTRAYFAAAAGYWADTGATGGF